MTPVVCALLKARHETQGCPSDGWIFPSVSKEGHLTGDGVKDQHRRALKDSNVARFVPYVLRHTALTRLAKVTNGDVFALARIAGHSSITITQRYIHTQADTIEGIFARAVLSQNIRREKAEEGAELEEVGTKLGTGGKRTARPLLQERNKFLI